MLFGCFVFIYQKKDETKNAIGTKTDSVVIVIAVGRVNRRTVDIR